MRKVLVLDDDADILQIVTEVLTYEKFDVSGISAGAELCRLSGNISPI